MSERVNKIIISKNNCKDPNEFYNHINEQINLLLECGYSCFISPMNDSRDVVNIEFCPIKEIKELKDTIQIIPDDYVIQTKTEISDKQTNSQNKKTEPIIFISHSSADKKYGDALRKFIIGLGVNN